MHRRLSRTTVRLATVAVGSTGLILATSGTPVYADREGTTRVAVAPAVVKKITALGLTAAPTKGADAISYQGTVALRFPVTKVENNGNRFEHVGGVKIASEHDYITTKRFTIKLKQRKVAATVVVNGHTVGRVDVFNVRASNRPKLGSARLTLTRAAAQAINSTFGAPAFERNDNFAFADVLVK